MYRSRCWQMIRSLSQRGQTVSLAVSINGRAADLSMARRMPHHDFLSPMLKLSHPGLSSARLFCPVPAFPRYFSFLAWPRVRVDVLIADERRGQRLHADRFTSHTTSFFRDRAA